MLPIASTLRPTLLVARALVHLSSNRHSELLLPLTICLEPLPALLAHLPSRRVQDLAPPPPQVGCLVVVEDLDNRNNLLPRRVSLAPPPHRRRECLEALEPPRLPRPPLALRPPEVCLVKHQSLLPTRSALGSRLLQRWAEGVCLANPSSPLSRMPLASLLLLRAVYLANQLSLLPVDSPLVSVVHPPLEHKIMFG